jgi:SsrA-binding protein
VARNSKARHDYHILETWEAGVVLSGTEIKSVRTVRRGEVWIEGMTIALYESAGYVNHEPRRARKLLLQAREIRRLIGSVEQKGLTLIPLDVHLARGRAKVTLALARGKKEHDKRETLKRRMADREAARAMGRRR